MRKQARKIMDRWQSDIVIAGYVWEDKKWLNLWIIPREGDGTLHDRVDRSYEVIKTNLLPEFHEDLRTQLVVYALKAVAPLADTEVRGQVLEDELVKAVDRVANLLDDYPGDASSRADLQNAYADALSTLGERESDTGRLEAAVAAYREVLEERTRERVPLQWAMTQNNLGSALTRLGERESGTGRLEEAVDAYREALKESTRERVPLQWAMTQSNLGNALFSLGERESGTGRLEEAVDALREALEERTREHVPLQWAITQSNLASALSSLGERESGTDRLEEAVDAYREALEEITRERVPLYWATTQNNLGVAFFELGKRESGTGRLEEAVAAHRKALEERTRERVPLDWAMTQNNLGKALVSLGEREISLGERESGSGTGRLEEAVAAYRKALEAITPEHSPHQWAMVQNNLDNALSRLCKRESDMGISGTNCPP